MIAVKVGDVIQTRVPHEPGVKHGMSFRVTAIAYATHPELPIPEGTPSGYRCVLDDPPGRPERGRTFIHADQVSRNITTGEGCEPVRRPLACKFYHREAFNGYEREFGAETLSELYALMAATGVKFTSVPPTSRVEAILNTQLPPDPKYPSAFNDHLGSGPSASDPDEAAWLAKRGYTVAPTDDTDPRPHVVGS